MQLPKNDSYSTQLNIRYIQLLFIAENIAKILHSFAGQCWSEAGHTIRVCLSPLGAGVAWLDGYVNYYGSKLHLPFGIVYPEKW